MLVYLRGHEGRCIGLRQKLRAHAIQDQGYDTVEANHRLGLPADARSYGVAAHILQEQGINSIRLMTNNPAKCAQLQSYGIHTVERVPLIVSPTTDNVRYLQAKQDKLGHLLDLAR